MLDRVFRQQFINLPVWLKTLERRLNNTVEKEGRIYKQRKANNLQPFESFPTKSQGDYPDE